MADCEYFQGKYRSQSTRLRHFDYRANGAYFVTICTKNRIPWFVTIHNGIMGLSEVGCIVADEWQKTGIIRPNVYLDEWIVMPDHMHGIVVIKNQPTNPVDAARRAASTDIAITIPLPCLRSGDLGAIIGRFKYACTKRIREMGHIDFRWPKKPIHYG